MIDDGGQAVRVSVEIGSESVNTVEVRKGLQVGDTVILSDSCPLGITPIEST